LETLRKGELLMVESKSRKSFTLRLQPYEGTIIAEVVEYLNSLDNQEINQTIIHILIMTLWVAA